MSSLSYFYPKKFNLIVTFLQRSCKKHHLPIHPHP
nr:MAG TPA_asm: hypothetical protein [Caudoviricetes sp.]